jgi:hypothetical protein
MLVVRGDEHDVRCLRIAAQSLGKREAGQARHLDVEEHDVGRQFIDQAQGIEPVGSLADDAQCRPGERKLRLQVSAQMGFVVGDQGPWVVDGSVSFSGSIRRTVMPQG